MPLDTIIQFNIIFYAIIGGILIGVMFDLYRAIRGEEVPKVIEVIQDILFWILAAMIIFSFLLYTNYAFLGVYVYIFMMVSFLIYLKTLSKTFIKIENKIIDFIAKTIRITFKNMIYPIKIIFFYIKGKNN